MRKAKENLSSPARRIRIGLAGAACALAACVLPASALGTTDTTQFSVSAGSLAFDADPNVPDLPGLTLSGQAQTVNAQMANFTIEDASGTGAGYNVTVAGDSAAGKSPVFKQYNTVTQTYGTAALLANSLTLTSTGADFSGIGGTTGTKPSHQCGSGCFVDSASPVEVVSAAAGTGMGTWATTGYSASSLALAAPSTLQALDADEVYRVDLVWSLNSGP
ncbi:MAG: WxL domain-containing protein [Solirubrobacterales bacterium]